MFMNELKKAADKAWAGSGFPRLTKRDRLRAMQRMQARLARLVRYAYTHPTGALNRKQRRSAHHFDWKLRRRGREPAQVPAATMKPAARVRLDANGRTVYAPSR